MPTSAAGSLEPGLIKPMRGFTLLELLVVLAIVAIGSAGVSLALPDSTATRLAREAQRLGALLESARARAQVSGVPVRWVITANGFRFDGLPMAAPSDADLPRTWLDPDTQASVETPPALPGLDGMAEAAPNTLLLGPEPIIGPQAVLLSSRSAPAQSLRLATDGVRPFALP